MKGLIYSVMNSSQYFDYIEEKLNYLALRLESRAKLNLLNLHIHAEDFYKQLFNILFGWNLVNLNLLEKNSAGIDLIDIENKIIISVSGTATKAKIVAGMTREDIKKYDGYKFKFISISKSVKSLKSNKYPDNPHNLDFDPNKDIFDKDKLLNEIMHVDSSKSYELYKLFKAEFSNDSENLDQNCFDKSKYSEIALDNYQNSDSKYTMLIAEQKEMDTFVDVCDKSTVEKTIKVLDILTSNNNCNVCYLLGESGSGKSTSLWKIFTNQCLSISQGNDIQAPIFIPIRRWSFELNLLELFTEALINRYDNKNLVNELKTGSFVFLIDGINEVESEYSSKCYNDIANFISKYPKNRYVISCRKSDYRKNIIPITSYSPLFEKPDIYEISRLSKTQLIDYSVNYFNDFSQDAEEFLNKIEAYNDTAWRSNSSCLQLARIPLFLQIFLETYRRTGYLPDSKAKLLKSLINIFFEREKSLNTCFFDQHILETTLSKLSFDLQETGYKFRLPTSIAKAKLVTILSELKASGIANSEIDFTNFWNRIISANYLKPYSDSFVEWLHQLIRDYFLGVEIANLWLESNEKKKLIKKMANSSQWDMPFTISLDILSGTHEGAELLWMLLESDKDCLSDNAIKVFEGQSSRARLEISSILIKDVLDDGDFETNKLIKLAKKLPFYEVAEALNDNFYHTKSENMIARIMDALSGMVIEHLPNIDIRAQQSSPMFINHFYYKEREDEVVRAVKRCKELLLKHLNGNNELASFYAVKGLWESDRPLCIEQLKILSKSKDKNIRILVDELVDEWGIS